MSLDLSTIDFHLAVTICRKHHLSAALFYLFINGLDEYPPFFLIFLFLLFLLLLLLLILFLFLFLPLLIHRHCHYRRRHLHLRFLLLTRLLFP